MSAENDLALAYHMGYDDALAKRKPDASKAQVLAPYDLAAENANLRELVRHLYEYRQSYFKTGIYPTDHGVTEQRMSELGVEVEL